MQTIVMTSNVSDWTLPGFAYLFNKYVDGDLISRVTVCGYRQPPQKLTGKYEFYKIGAFEEYPQSKWSQSLQVVLQHVADDAFLLMLDDYWVYRQADTKGLRILYDYVRQFGYVLKADVAAERLNNNPGRYHFNQNTYAHAGHLDLIKSPPGSSYQMSLWAGIWNRDNLKRLLVPNESAQQIELNGTNRINAETVQEEKVIVIGTRQAPLLHGNILQSGRKTPVYEDIGWKISDSDLHEMSGKGMIRDVK